jgi:hypothetical protein
LFSQWKVDVKIGVPTGIWDIREVSMQVRPMKSNALPVIQ